MVKAAREFMTTKRTLQKVLEGMRKHEEKDKHNQEVNKKFPKAIKSGSGSVIFLIIHLSVINEY